MSARSGSVTGLGKTRVEALTDGIFGAVMTVLGLSLTIPYITGTANQQLPALEDIVTGVLTYALSFVTVGVFWVGHHVGFQIVKRTDRTFIWLNNTFLLFVGLLPLTTALLGHHPFEQLTIVAYGLNLLAIQIFMFLTLWYATLHHHLVEAGLNDRLLTPPLCGAELGRPLRARLRQGRSGVRAAYPGGATWARAEGKAPTP